MLEGPHDPACRTYDDEACSCRLAKARKTPPRCRLLGCSPDRAKSQPSPNGPRRRLSPCRRCGDPVEWLVAWNTGPIAADGDAAKHSIAVTPWPKGRPPTAHPNDAPADDRASKPARFYAARGGVLVDTDNPEEAVAVSYEVHPHLSPGFDGPVIQARHADGALRAVRVRLTRPAHDAPPDDRARKPIDHEKRECADAVAGPCLAHLEEEALRRDEKAVLEAYRRGVRHGKKETEAEAWTFLFNCPYPGCHGSVTWQSSPGHPPILAWTVLDQWKENVVGHLNTHDQPLPQPDEPTTPPRPAVHPIDDHPGPVRHQEKP